VGYPVWSGLLARMAEGKPVESVHVSLAADTGEFRYEIA
jgi:hypothetical protein